MHSGTKYFGGHSDLLCGVLVASPQREDWFKGLWMDRMDLGSVMGNMESWLTVRSLRTLELRVTRQSRNADKIVDWLDKGMNDKFTHDDGEQAASDVSLIKSHVTKLYHASLQARDPANAWLPLQMPNGYGPVFALHLATPEMARRFPSYLELFHHATSLGGVESLVEWRAMSDETIDRRLVRFSIGVEDVEDLIEDIRGALRKLEAWNKEQERGQK
jgi:cystathionine beta-lyase/cystathionine gamma-synthase